MYAIYLNADIDPKWDDPKPIDWIEETRKFEEKQAFLKQQGENFQSARKILNAFPSRMPTHHNEIQNMQVNLFTTTSAALSERRNIEFFFVFYNTIIFNFFLHYFCCVLNPFYIC